MSTTPRRRRFTGAALAAGVGGSLAIALPMGASLSGYVATITNTTNTAATAAMAFAETSGAATCNSYDSTATCTTINKYGGTGTPLVPGGSQTTTVTLANTGTVAAATATMDGGVCTAATRSGVTGATTPTTPNTTAGNLCSVLGLKVYAAATATGSPIYNDTLANFDSAAAVALAAYPLSASQAYTFVVTMPSSATTAVQGQSVSQPIVWTFTQ